MFNTDQLMALQHPKEHKYHIITSPWHRVRTKAQRTSLRRGAVCHGLHRSLLTALPHTKAASPQSSPLGDTCPPMMIIQQTLMATNLLSPEDLGTILQEEEAVRS